MEDKDYSVNELIHNPSFRRMVRGMASADEIDRWNHWIEASVQNRKKAKEAIAEIAGFQFKGIEKPDVSEEWARLYDVTVGKSDDRRYNQLSRDTSLTWIYRIAAILILGVMVGVGIYLYPDSDRVSTWVEQITQEQTITAESDEQKTIRFSDGSKIVLNSNSTVTYRLGLLHNQTIEVTLEGEAYFDAQSEAGQEPVFAVRTPDGVLRDIGTKFLVTVHNDYSAVVLQEGVVEVDTENQAKVEVKKGEMLAFTKSELIDKRNVNPTFYTSWATGAMEFDQTSLQEFAEFVERRFGVEVEVTDSSLADITLDGAVYFQSLEELVRAVSEVTQIPVYQSGDRKKVYIGDMTSGSNQSQ